MAVDRLLVDPNYPYDGIPQTTYFDSILLTVNNGAIGGELTVNSSRDGDQRFPGVAMNATGDFVVAWSGNGTMQGQEDPQSVFFQRFAQVGDTAGPTVGAVYNVVTSGGTTTRQQILDSAVLTSLPTQFIVTFGEELSTQNTRSGANSILNLANWQLSGANGAISGAISDVQYGWNSVDQKWEAIVTLRSTNAAGAPLLGQGTFKLGILSSVQDIFGNPFDGGYTAAGASNFSQTFTVVGSSDYNGVITPPDNPNGTPDTRVNTYDTAQTAPAPVVAADANGDYAIAWVTHYYGDGTTTDANNQFLDGGDIAVQRYDSSGKALGGEFLVSQRSRTTDAAGHTIFSSNGTQIQPAIAMDSYGDFVVVWSGFGPNDDAGIFAQIYDKNGKAFGGTITVNQAVVGLQNAPSVAMDTNGNFVVSWTSFGQGADANGGIYARRFSSVGVPLGGDLLVNTTTANRQDNSNVGMDANGDFVVVWESDRQDGNTLGVFGQRFNAAGDKAGGEFRVNKYTLDKQSSPAVAMDAAGDFVVAWQSLGQDGSGYGVYSKRYNAAGVALNANDLLVNQTKLNWQITPDVAMASDGRYVITWSSFGQDNMKVSSPSADYGIYARIFNANGSDYRNAVSGAVVGETLINKTTKGDQKSPAVAMSANGRIVTVWSGPASTPRMNPITQRPIVESDVFCRVIGLGYENLVPNLYTGPAISGVSLSFTKNQLAFNAADTEGVAKVTLKIDGKALKPIGSLAAAASAGNSYYGKWGTLALGKHNYVITATDRRGNVSTVRGAFAMTAAPKVSNVTTAVAKRLISWKVAAPAGVAAYALTIDGKPASPITPPGKPAQAYSGSMGALKAGKHNFVITITDKVGRVAQAKGSFTVTAPKVVRNAVFSNVARSALSNSAKVDWLLDLNGISSTVNRRPQIRTPRPTPRMPSWPPTN